MNTTVTAAHDQTANLNRLPLSQELLRYYKERIEQNELELQSYITAIDAIKTSHTDHHKLTCELQHRADEISALQSAISESQTALIAERKQLLKLLGENDELRIQELKDRRKIRYLLGLCGMLVPEDETTYLKPRIHKSLVHPHTPHTKTQSRPPLPPPTQHDPGALSEPTSTEDPGLTLTDENRILKLQVQALRCQLQEQNTVQQESIDRLVKDAQIRSQEDKLRSKADAMRIQELTDRLSKYKQVLTENTKEVLVIRKSYLVNERLLKEERVRLIEEVNTLRTRYLDLKNKSEQVERAVEARVTKRNDKIILDLRTQLDKYEKELKGTRLEVAERELGAKKTIEGLQRKADSLRNDYAALKKRRGYEIEGFTNDIKILRRRVKDLERHIVKITPMHQAQSAMLQMMDKAIKRAASLEKKFQMQNAFT